VYVPRELLGAAVEALTGASIAGKTARAEPARERPPVDDKDVSLSDSPDVQPRPTP
jgi:hypothetical protein